MAYAPAQIDPDIEHIVILHRDGKGNKTVVADLDPGLTKKRPKPIEITVIQPESYGDDTGGGRRKKKKHSKLVRPFEKRTRKSVVKVMNVMEDYLYLHDRSNRKKKNGWMKSYAKNLRKALKRNSD